MSMSGMSGMSMGSSASGMSGMTATATSAMSGHTGMSSSGMDMESMMVDNDKMPASMMAMTFFTSNNTPLWSDALLPTTDGQYAGVCILLIFLSFVLRALFAVKSSLEARWYAKAAKRRYIVPAGRSNSDAASKEAMITATLTSRGCTEEVKIVESPEAGAHMPWRFSVDVSRAALVTLILGLGYLLMLAVMTVNVGYFLSVLAGAFVGEIFFGRFSSHDGVGH